MARIRTRLKISHPQLNSNRPSPLNSYGQEKQRNMEIISQPSLQMVVLLQYSVTMNNAHSVPLLSMVAPQKI
jgi:hypothetical protein